MLNRIAMAVAVVCALLVAVSLILSALGVDVLRLDVAAFCGLFVVAHLLAEVEARHDAAQHLHVRHRSAATSRA